MRIIIIAVGRLKSGPERTLAERYLSRCRAGGSKLGLKDFQVSQINESRAAKARTRKSHEAAAILGAIPDNARLIALDETGTSQTSAQFATMISSWREQGQRQACFVIGGPDGLDEKVRSHADTVLSFSPMTWPHQMARVMLAEQLYRATTILARHPYHRG